MTLGTDILEAVQRGGINNWTTTQNQSPTNMYTSKNRRNETEHKMDKIYGSIKGVMNANEISKESGFSQDTTYKYLLRLMDEGRVIRTQRGQPYSYMRKQ